MTRPRCCRILLFLLALLVALPLTGIAAAAANKRFLRVELRTTAGSFAQLYWHFGTGFNEERSVRAPLVRTPGNFQELSLELPPGNIRGLRFDPTDAPGEIVIRRISVLDSAGAVLAHVNPGSLLPFNHVAAMTREGELTRVVTPPDGGDPALLVTAACLEGEAPWYGMLSVTPLSLMLASGAVMAFIGACLAIIGRDLVQRHRTASSSARRLHALCWLAALFTIIAAAKLYLIEEFPAPVPFVDQWPAEAGALYVPFSERCLAWRDMFTLHNEHRMFFTRLLALALLFLNRQWDPQLEQPAGTAIHAICGVTLAAAIWVSGGRKHLDFLALLIGLAFALPFGWENTLSGFQSAFYFLLLFSVLALLLTPGSRPGSMRWACGWLCALCALFTAASGIFAGVAVMAAVSLEALGNRQRRAIVPNAAVFLVLASLAIWLASPPIAYLAPLRATSPREFLGALGRNLAWPFVDHPLFSAVMWLPLAAVASTRVVRRQPPDERERLLFGLAVWVVSSAVAVAYARGAGGQAPASRYTDFLSLGFVANGSMLTSSLDSPLDRRWSRRAALGFSAMWLVFAMIGLDGVTQNALQTGAAARLNWMNAYVSNLRRFVLTDDMTALQSKAFPQEVPWVDPVQLGNAWLRHPYVRRILPTAIREPLHVRAARITNQAFVRNGFYPTTPFDPLEPMWGSYTDRGNPATGRFESEDIPRCGLAHLQVSVAGYLGGDGMALRLIDSSGGEHAFAPTEPAREQWKPLTTRCPSGSFRIVADDDNPALWMAFREPIEQGWASAISESLIERSRGLLIFGAALLTLAVRFSPAAWRPGSR